MKIVFDSQIFCMQEYGGVSRYFCSLARQFTKTQAAQVKIFTPFYINAYVDRLPKSIVTGYKVPQIPKITKLFQLSGAILARRLITNYAPDIVHETYFAARPSAQKQVSTVLTVYDMIHELFPSSFPASEKTSMLKRKAVLRADHIICISENTRNDLLNLIPVSPDKVSVVYLGWDPLVSNDNYASLTTILSESPYLLFVGLRSEYKNFAGLLQAYASSNWLMQNFKIICVGGGKLKAEELKMLHDLGIAKTQVQQKNADDFLLAAYYKNAAALIYPSLYEGFGIPPLEAMSLECPVICSNSSSITEVVNEAGEYFDPGSIDSIRFAIEKVLQSDERRESLIQKGKERYAVFSWQRCAAETLDIYRSVV